MTLSEYSWVVLKEKLFAVESTIETRVTSESQVTRSRSIIVTTLRTEVNLSMNTG
jgi:hypothetical protein